jgi:two-component sensor histidine kinase
MLAAPAAALASAEEREITFHAQPTCSAEERLRRMNGLLALSECPAGVTAVTTLGALLSRISRSTQVCFGPHLRNVCDDLSATWGRAGGPELRCVTTDCLLPIGAAVTLGLIADLLITNAFVYAFPPGSRGLIAVSFAAGTEAWRLTVDDSGIAIQGTATGATMA